jgi:ketol-acid reductoisomerase
LDVRELFYYGSAWRIGLVEEIPRCNSSVFKELYESVAAGKESQRSIDSNSQPDYREKLEVELKELRESEMWQAGKTVRSLRPENQPAKSDRKLKL